ncbi:MAG: hypothetical protein R3A11_10020 [Bdellovibrionota bacterium]
MRDLFCFIMTIVLSLVTSDLWAQHDLLNGIKNDILHFEWEYKGDYYTFNFTIPDVDKCLDELREKPHIFPHSRERDNQPTLEKKYFISFHHQCDDVFSEFLDEFLFEIFVYSFDKFHAVEFILNFVHSIPYEFDQIGYKEDRGMEYVQYPIETLIKMQGDCEDHAILLAAMLSRYGQEVIVVDAIGHWMTAVYMETYETKYQANSFFYLHNGKKYVFCESTPGLRVSEEKKGIFDETRVGSEFYFTSGAGSEYKDKGYPSSKKNVTGHPAVEEVFVVPISIDPSLCLMEDYIDVDK